MRYRLKARASYAVNYVASVFRLKPVLDRITLNDTFTTEFGLSVIYVANADLVLIMSARPSFDRSYDPVCVQHDQHHRCTVGRINVPPVVLDEDTSNQYPTEVSDVAFLLRAVLAIMVRR